MNEQQRNRFFISVCIKAREAESMEELKMNPCNEPYKWAQRITRLNKTLTKCEKHENSACFYP